MKYKENYNDTQKILSFSFCRDNVPFYELYYVWNHHFLNLGFIPSFFAQWLLEAFPKAWVAAFPIVFFVAPRAAKLAESLMKK
ncbi:DUF2798 domain-containing protein [Helicobacter pullorum]|uniref:DUF2798 domain-containing protein n=1 Tax=Helicobacter pullorum TaxID=35818 RepID=UPI0027B99C8A|nr:DUF2798 domain-containing protein [Helicobacter pullorum]